MKEKITRWLIKILKSFARGLLIAFVLLGSGIAIGMIKGGYFGKGAPEVNTVEEWQAYQWCEDEAKSNLSYPATFKREGVYDTTVFPNGRRSVSFTFSGKNAYGVPDAFYIRCLFIKEKGKYRLEPTITRP